MLDKLIKYYKILKTIFNNRDKFFASNYWKTFILLLRIRLKLLMAYYLKTNKQTKVLSTTYNIILITYKITK